MLKKLAAGILAAVIMCGSVITASAEELGVEINEENFPDDELRLWATWYDEDENGYLSGEEAAKLTYIESSSIADLKGIEYFTELTSLQVDNENITEADLSQNTKLRQLYVTDTSITELDLRNNTELLNLSCYGCPITKIDLSGCEKLQTLSIYNIKATALDISNNPELRSLYAQWNNFTELDISNNEYLLKAYTEYTELGDWGEGTTTYRYEDDDVSYGGGLSGIVKWYVLCVDDTVNIITGAAEPADGNTSDDDNTTASDTLLTDSATDITVAAEAGVLPDGVKLNVVAGEKTDTQVSYDITLADADGNEIQPDGYVTVKLPVPESWAADKLYVYRAEDDGSYTDMKAVYADGYVTFITDHFSTYILTTELISSDKLTTGEPATDKPTPNGDNDLTSSVPDDDAPETGSAAGFELAALAFAGVAIVVTNKRK